MKLIRQRWFCKRCNYTVDTEALPITAMYCPKGHLMRQLEGVSA